MEIRKWKWYFPLNGSIFKYPTPHYNVPILQCMGHIQPMKIINVFSPPPTCLNVVFSLFGPGVNLSCSEYIQSQKCAKNYWMLMPDTISWLTDLTRYQERQTHPFEMTPVPHHESTSGCFAVICLGFETIMKQHLFSIWLFQLNELFANSRAAEEQALSLCLLSDLSSRVLCKMMPSFFLLYTCTFDPSRSLSRTHLCLLSDLSSFVPCKTVMSILCWFLKHRLSRLSTDS